MQQRITSTSLPDGTQIAYALAGQGPLLVYAPGWLTHLERSWAMPPERAFYEALARGRTLLRYDKPGCGLSGPSSQPHSMELELQTLDAVTRAVGADQFDLLGTSMGAAVAASWAAAHPGRVARLVLYGGWVSGQQISGPDVQESVLGLVERHWGLGSDVLGEIFAPGADAATRAAFVHYQREAASPKTARDLLALCYQIDVSEVGPRIQVPTLVIHRDQDRAAPLEQGRELAELIPDARFEVLPGRAHLPFIGDADALAGAIRRFLGLPGAAPPGHARAHPAPARGGRADRPGPDQPRDSGAAGHHRAVSGVARRADQGPAGVPLAGPDRGLVRGQRPGQLSRPGHRAGQATEPARSAAGPGQRPAGAGCGISPAVTGRVIAHDRAMRSSIRRAVLTGYAGLAYLAFVASAGWAIGFLADLRVPNPVDGPARGPGWAALLLDVVLLLIFAVQHTVMARAGFKRWLARLLPGAAERSTYVLAASLALLLLFWQWRPVPGSIWRVSAAPWAQVFWAVYAAGWLVALGTTFMIDHLDFLGLRQARWDAARGPYQPPSFSERWLYAWIRHPMMAGLLIAFWATPRLTVSHLVFAVAGTGYIGAGLRFEERDAGRQLGQVYRDYAQRVPALLPGTKSQPAAAQRAPRTSG